MSYNTLYHIMNVVDSYNLFAKRGCLTRGSLFYYKERQIITQADSVMESACGV